MFLLSFISSQILGDNEKSASLFSLARTVPRVFVRQQDARKRVRRRRNMKKSLLVADDDPSVREALKKVLEDAGYEVILAADGKEAESRLDNPGIDLLILDLNMPNRDGWDVLEDASSGRPFMPILVVTGMTDQLATFDIPGAAALMAKPIEAPALLQKIESLLAESVEMRLLKNRNELEWASSAVSIGARHSANAAKGFRRS